MLSVKYGKLKAAPQISVVALNPSVVSAPIGIIGKNFVTSVTKKFVDGVLKKALTWYNLVLSQHQDHSGAHLALKPFYIYKWVIDKNQSVRYVM